MTRLRKILHVDDDPDILEIARLSLEEIGGFVLLQYKNAQDAIENAESFLPDLFLLDMKLPDLSGIEILNELRQIECLKNVPAILLTAKGLIDDQVHELESLGIGIIQKPFDPINLPSLVLQKFVEQTK